MIPPSHADRLANAIPSLKQCQRTAHGLASVLAAYPLVLDWQLQYR